MDHVVHEFESAVIVRIRHFGESCGWSIICKPNQLRLPAPKLPHVPVVHLIHGDDIVEAVQVLTDHETGGALVFDPLLLEDLARPAMRRLAHVPMARARRIRLHYAVQMFLAYQMPEHRFRHRRAAYIPKADEKDPYHVKLVNWSISQMVCQLTND